MGLTSFHCSTPNVQIVVYIGSSIRSWGLHAISAVIWWVWHKHKPGRIGSQNKNAKANSPTHYFQLGHALHWQVFKLPFKLLITVSSGVSEWAEYELLFVDYYIPMYMQGAVQSCNPWDTLFHIKPVRFSGFSVWTCLPFIFMQGLGNSNEGCRMHWMYLEVNGFNKMDEVIFKFK